MSPATDSRKSALVPARAGTRRPLADLSPGLAPAVRGRTVAGLFSAQECAYKMARGSGS